MHLRFETEGHVAVITLDRPDAMNALDAEMYRELSETFIRVRDDPDIWSAIIIGAGNKAFCAGADLKARVTEKQPAHVLWSTQREPLLNRGLEVWKPVIAAVNGYCLGGGMTLLLATDIRIAAEHATFGLPEVKRGMLPANGGTQRLLRQMPFAAAMEMLLLGDQMIAADALRYGLVNRVVPLADLLPTAKDVARRLCERPPLAVQAIKELAIRSLDLDIADGLRMEQFVQLALSGTDDRTEGVRAFAEKRKPVFKGR